MKDDNIAGFAMYATGYLKNAHFSLLFLGVMQMEGVFI